MFSPAARINRWLRRHKRHTTTQCLILDLLDEPSDYEEGMWDAYQTELRMLAEDPDPSFKKTAVRAFAFAAWASDHPLELGGFGYALGVRDAENRLGRWCARHAPRHARIDRKKKERDATLSLLPMQDTIDRLNEIKSNLVYSTLEYPAKIQLVEDEMETCFAVDDLIGALRRVNLDLFVANNPIPAADPGEMLDIKSERKGPTQ